MTTQAWQPIETAPKQEPILLYSPEFDSRHRGVYQASLIDNYFDDAPELISHPYMPCKWTHWMPLPEPPQ